jgi:hypothetical protein
MNRHALYVLCKKDIFYLDGDATKATTALSATLLVHAVRAVTWLSRLRGAMQANVDS